MTMAIMTEYLSFSGSKCSAWKKRAKEMNKWTQHANHISKTFPLNISLSCKLERWLLGCQTCKRAFQVLYFHVTQKRHLFNQPSTKMQIPVFAGDSTETFVCHCRKTCYVGLHDRVCVCAAHPPAVILAWIYFNYTHQRNYCFGANVLLQRNQSLCAKSAGREERWSVIFGEWWNGETGEIFVLPCVFVASEIRSDVQVKQHCAIWRCGMVSILPKFKSSIE